MPSIRGSRIPAVDPEGLKNAGFAPIEQFPSQSLEPGINVTCAVDLDVCAVHVAQDLLDRWDKTIDEVIVAGLANLRRTVATWDGGIFHDSIDGVPIKQLSPWPPWAVTLLLLPDELRRIFGGEDQLFIAPYHCTLFSLPIYADRDLAADVIDTFGHLNPSSLLLGLPAFALRDGVLSTEDLPGWSDKPAADGGGISMSALLGW
jgi:hypothetical protein